MSVTKHAAVRCQQRGVSPLVIDLLLKFGHRRRDHRGAEVVFFDRRAKREVAQYTGGALGKLSEQMDAYAVLSDGRVVTAGARYRKINRVV